MPPASIWETWQQGLKVTLERNGEKFVFWVMWGGWVGGKKLSFSDKSSGHGRKHTCLDLGEAVTAPVRENHDDVLYVKGN